MNPYVRIALELIAVALIALILSYLEEAHLAFLVVVAWIIGTLFGRVINNWLERMEE